MSLQSKIAKARAQGYYRTFELQFNRFVPPWVFRYSMGDVFEFDIEGMKALGNSSRGNDDQLNVECLGEFADPDQRLQLRKFSWNSVPIETTTRHIGYALTGVDEPDKLLGGVWVGIGSFLENNLGIQFEFKDRQAWLYNAYVHDDAKGKGVYKRLLSHAASDVERRGITELFGVVQPWNKISYRLHQKQSLRICGRISATRIGSRAWIRHSDGLKVDKKVVKDVNDPAVVRIPSAAVKQPAAIGV